MIKLIPKKHSIKHTILGITYIFISLSFNSQAAVTKKAFDFVVGVNGDFSAAIAAASSAASSGKRFYIFFPDGNYDIGNNTGDGNQMTTINIPNVSYIGQNSSNVVLYNKPTSESISTTATIYLGSASKDIYMQDLSLNNRYPYDGSTGRGVALRDAGTRNIFKNIKLLSYQDTYYSGSGRMYFETCQINGVVDFICGSGDVFFNQCLLYLENRTNNVIAAPNTTTSWGYVFSGCTIDGASINNNVYKLGRSWNNVSKCVYINTTMKILPVSTGWGDPMNANPTVAAEYNSITSSGATVDLSNRRSSYTYNGSTVTIDPTLSASQAANYSISNVLSGSDSWDPEALAQQVTTPVISISGATISWSDNSNVLCWGIFKDNKFVKFVTSTNYNIPSGTADGSIYTVRAANSMGGLSSNSNAINYTSVIALDSPTGVTANASYNSVTLNWNTVTDATGYLINFCEPPSGTIIRDSWDFTGSWSISASDADANLVEDATAGRFNYIPTTTNTALSRANGNSISDVAGLLFTQAGTSKIRLGYNLGQLYLNGTAIEITIPCQVGDKITVVGPAGSATAADRGYSANGGTLNTSESSNVSSSGIMNQAGAIGTWVYDANSTMLKLTTVTGGMNIQSITVTNAASPTCTQYTVTGGNTTTKTITSLTPSTLYTYQIKATNGVPEETSAYTTASDITTSDNNPTLNSSSNKTQSVPSGTAIADIVLTWGGGATDALVVGLPTGITATKDVTTKRITISGLPTATATYTVTTVGGAGAAIVVSGTISATPNPATLAIVGNDAQIITIGAAITDITLTWGGGATDVSISNLTSGLTTIKNTTTKTLTISGTPNTEGNTSFTITTIGGTSSAVYKTASILVKSVMTCVNMQTIQITDLSSAGTYSLNLFDASGNTLVEKLASGYFNAGNSDFLFEKGSLTSGTYTYKLIAGASTIQSGLVILP